MSQIVLKGSKGLGNWVEGGWLCNENQLESQISHLFPFTSEGHICRQASSAESRSPSGKSTSVSHLVSQLHLYHPLRPPSFLVQS